jgi:hypothetical protein
MWEAVKPEIGDEEAFERIGLGADEFILRFGSQGDLRINMLGEEATLLIT